MKPPLTPQPTSRSQPWLSLVLLFAAYVVFSWFLAHLTLAWVPWALVLLFTLGESLLLTTAFDGLRRFVQRWLRSDVGYFTLIMIGSMGVTVALVWFRIFGYMIVLVAAEVLARLDLQNWQLKRWQAFLILETISLLGVAVGLLLSLHVMSSTVQSVVE